MRRAVTRRTVLWGGAGALGLAATGGAALSYDPVGRRVRGRLGAGPSGAPVPDAPEGAVSLTSVRSAARGRDVGLWTAVPAGSGAGAGLPVCLVLHGASATTADYSRFGLARFLTAAVRAGAPPFVLAGADGGRNRWLGSGPGSADDPQRMLAEELPSWCAERGFDPTRLAAYGWSMGGFGALRAAELRPGVLRAVAALSPAVRGGDEVFADVGALDGAGTGLWCGRPYWNSVTPTAFDFVGRRLTPT